MRPMFQTNDPTASATLQNYERQQLLHRARRYTYIKGTVNVVIALLFLLTFPSELRPKMVAIVLADAWLLFPYRLLVRRYPTLATCLSLGLTALAISAGDWVGGYQTGASGILYALLIVGGHLVLIKPLSTYLVSVLIVAIYVSTIALEVSGIVPIHFPFTLSNLLRVVSLNVISMFGLTVLTQVVTRLYRELLQRNKELLVLNAISTTASQALDPDTVLQLVLDRVLEMMELEEGGLYLLEANTGELVLQAHRNSGCARWAPRIEDFTALPFEVDRVQVVDDSSRHPALSEIVGDGHHPLAIVPLKAKDKVLGTMNLLGRTGCAFTARDVALLNAIGAQLGLIIEKERLRKRGQKQAAQLAVVNSVARQSTSILDLRQLLPEVVTAIRQSFNYYHVGLFLLDETAGKLRLRAMAGGFAEVAPPDHHLALGEGIAGWVAQTGRSLLVNDVSREPRYVLGILKEALTKAELCVPLKLAGKVIGVLDIQSTHLNAFDETDLMALEILADQIAMAIENARLFEETKHRLEEMTALYQTSLDITARLEAPELLKSIIEQAVNLLRAETGGIFLYEPEREELRGAIGYGYIEQYVGITLKPGEGIAGKVFQTGEPLIVNDYRSWEGKASVHGTGHPFTAVLEVPLKWQEQVIGVLVIATTREERTFDQNDLWLATLFANQAAVAIENAHLYESERRQLRGLEGLAAASQRITAKLDLTSVLEEIVAQALTTLEVDRAAIFLLDEEADTPACVCVNGLSPEYVEEINRHYRNLPGTRLIRFPEPIHILDAQTDPDTAVLREAIIREGYHTFAVLPLIGRGKVMGAMSIYRDEVRAFRPEELTLARSFANQAAVAIENARLYQQTDEKLQARVRELAVLYAVAEMVNRSFNLDEILHLALDSAIEVAGMDLGGILLLDPSTHELSLKTCRRGSPEFVQAIDRIRADENLALRMLNSVLIMGDSAAGAEDCPLAIERAMEKAGLRSLISVPLRARESRLGVMVMAGSDLRTVALQEVELLDAIGSQVGLAVDRANLQAQELRAAILEERQDMARQMHDDIAQTLSYLGLQIDGVMDNSSLAQNVKIQAELEEIRGVIEEAYERVRSSITRLREDVPDHFDLGVVLPELIRGFEERTGCRVETKLEADRLSRLPPSVAFQATYIIREALANVRKHSGADLVHLTLQGRGEGMIELTIQDNGRGFDPDSGRQANWGSFGLRFMRERARRVGGSLRVESAPGRGTRVIVHLPTS